MEQCNNETIEQCRNTAYVAMSGGVDSSVAAHLLKEEGYNVVGVFMRCVNIDGCQERDAQDARHVAAHLGIPFYEWDFEDAYRKKVVEYMVAGYRRGETPNPDIMCNKEIKFGLFFDRAMQAGADFVATGHHVRKGEVGGVPAVQAGLDRGKDQSYFLWTLTPRVLEKCLFPIGNYQKETVRSIAEKASLPTAHKKDSQGICFLGQVSLADFLSSYISESRGDVVDTSGAVVGEHDGAAFYTIGQRHGFTVHTAGPNVAPHYVVEKDVSTNTLVVAEGREHPALSKKKIAIRDSIAHPSLHNKKIASVQARIRYQQPLTRAVWDLENNVVTFKIDQKFIACGQSVVCYGEDGNVLGGGVIASMH